MRIIKHMLAVGGGYRLATQVVTWEQVQDLFAIDRLNTRAARAWERYNNSGGNLGEKEDARLDRLQKRALSRARALAKKNGWTLDARGGLWWSVGSDKAENLLPGVRDLTKRG